MFPSYPGRRIWLNKDTQEAGAPWEGSFLTGLSQVNAVLKQSPSQGLQGESLIWKVPGTLAGEWEVKQEGGQPTGGVSFHHPPQGATELRPVEQLPWTWWTSPPEGAGAARSQHGS